MAPEVVNSAHHRYEYEPCHGVCALLQADRRLPGTPRCAGSMLTSCSCCESSSWSPSRRTAGLSPERRLLCARANRECATKRGARTAAIEPAGVLAVSSDANALRCCVLKQKPVVLTTILSERKSMVCERAGHQVSGPGAGTAGLQGRSTSLARRRAPLGAHGRLLEHINQFCRFQRNRCIESQLALRSPQKQHQGAHALHSCSRYSQ